MYPCGMIAKEMLEALTKGKTTTCIPTGKKHFKRIIARCFITVDIMEVMALFGHVVADERYSSDYLPFEEIARKNKLGMHQGSFITPRAYRNR
jgi:endonuclease YncB( thermonuclease family)